MKIVVFGLSVSSSWGNGHATIWRGLASALHRRGHTMVFFERDQPYYAAHRDLIDAPGLEIVFFDEFDDIAGRAALELAEADAGIVTSFCHDGRRASDLVLSSRVPVRCFYDLDTPVTLSAMKKEKVPYLPEDGLGEFDIVLSYTGGRALDRLCDDLGARRTAPLYGSVDPRVHRPTPGRREFRGDLSYLGTYSPDRQPALEELLVRTADALPDRGFVIAGAQYPSDFPWRPNIRFVRHLPPADHAAFYASSLLTLNVTRAPMAELGFCPSPRFFEAAACGVPTLSDIWEGIETFFAPGSELLLATSRDEVVAALNLSRAELSAIGRRARERTLSEHTADQRAAELEILLFGSGCARPQIPRPNTTEGRNTRCSA